MNFIVFIILGIFCVYLDNTLDSELDYTDVWILVFIIFLIYKLIKFVKKRNARTRQELEEFKSLLPKIYKGMSSYEFLNIFGCFKHKQKKNKLKFEFWIGYHADGFEFEFDYNNQLINYRTYTITQHIHYV